MIFRQIYQILNAEKKIKFSENKQNRKLFWTKVQSINAESDSDEEATEKKKNILQTNQNLYKQIGFVASIRHCVERIEKKRFVIFSSEIIGSVETVIVNL